MKTLIATIKSMDIVGVLTYLGITHDRVLPFLVLIIGMVWISYYFTKPIKKSISGITRAILEIQSVFKQSGIDLNFTV